MNTKWSVRIGGGSDMAKRANQTIIDLETEARWLNEKVGWCSQFIDRLLQDNENLRAAAKGGE